MPFSRFIGRESELARLKSLLDARSASLIVVRGRRRIGKSRLLAEFGRGIRSLFFSGIPPSKKTSTQSQKEEFAFQLERAGIPGIRADDWGNLFWHLSKATEKGPVLIVLDEVSWMGGKDPNFLGKLKIAWDLYFSQNPELILALCGSISSWIEENILSNTGFLGRIAIDMVLEELPLTACNAFWQPHEEHISPYEKFKMLSVTGGVPLYLERMQPRLSAEQNIRDLCFTKGGLLVREFDEIFSDLFSKKNILYKEIVSLLAEGAKDLTTLSHLLKRPVTGSFSQHLDHLVKAGFVCRDFIWNIANGQESKLSLYRLSDNYLRFYLKYIAPNRAKIERGQGPESTLSFLPAFDTVMGLQFENLVVHNRESVWKQLGLLRDEVLVDGPFFQNPTLKQLGCQIDYLIESRFQTLYLCEVKFSKNKVGKGVIKEVEEKKSRLKIPKFCSIRPVLIHVNGVQSSVVEAGYFDRIVDFGQLLT